MSDKQNFKKKIAILKKENEILETNLKKFKKIPIYEEVLHIYDDISKKLPQLLNGTADDIAYMLMSITDITDISNVITGAGLAFAPNVFKNKELSTYTKNGTYIFAPYVNSDGRINKYYDIAYDGYDYTDGTHEWWNEPVEKKKPIWIMPYYDDILDKKTISYSMPIYHKKRLLAVLKYDIPIDEFGDMCNI